MRVPNAAAFDYLRNGLARIVSVTDAEVADALRLIYRTTHNVAEGAGAAAFAAIGKERERLNGATVAGVITGGNVDSEWLRTVLTGGIPAV